MKKKSKRQQIEKDISDLQRAVKKESEKVRETEEQKREAEKKNLKV